MGATLLIILSIGCLSSLGCQYLIAQFVKKNNPRVWENFGWLEKPTFFSLRTSPRQTTAHRDLALWLKTSEAIDLRKKNAYFNSLLVIQNLLFWGTILTIISLVSMLIYMYIGGELVFDFSKRKGYP